MGQRTFCLKRLSRALAAASLVVVVLASNAGAPRAQDGETAEEVFYQYISEPIIQSRCVNCHVEGGASGHTRLVFVRSSDTADHEMLNLQSFEDFLAAVEDEGGGTLILNKIQGVSHGGGVQVPVGSVDFANMEDFLGLLGEQFASAALTPETLFETVVLASNRKTLRRAALIFAGRIPTDEEYAAVEDGDEWSLRATLQGLMEGPQFHEFLIRSSNDRLLTDRLVEPIIRASDVQFVAYVNEYYRRKEAVHANGDWSNFRFWRHTVDAGARQAPLELIAYVVENDLPYTEILTADYVMANPWAAAAYGASTHFDDPDDPYEFKPSRIVSYYRRGDGFESEHNVLIDAWRVLDPGPLITDYPHAGILNTKSFLTRYPTTATNRNRARARWTYYHFLGLDVEKSASRTTDPVALADTNNPTMHNPACTVCHSVLDPVAGAFQNYSDTGLYRYGWGGLDSLDQFYKDEGGLSLSIQAESWAERETLIWPLSLAAGIQTLRVVFSNDFYDANTGDDGTIYLDRLELRDVDGQALVGHEFEDLGPPIAPSGPCGNTQYNPANGLNDHLKMWKGGSQCAFYIDVEVPSDGAYDVEVVAWGDRYEQYGNGQDDFAEISVAANAYEAGDTWYRDMRFPGFAGAEAPHPDNSLQWLAEQIVADERFAEATVKFWWPAIMGSEIAEPPEDAADADFEGQLLAANAQDAEVVRLAQGFRDGFQGSPYTHNLKDLLVETVLSEWFRADALTDADPVRRVALRDAGARRLLTPEELARKTVAITGVQWGRRTSNPGRRWHSALTEEYRLLYGGIDSDGITERGRDITAVMAGVAQRHAVQVSCPVVLREFYLLPETERRLFTGIDRDATPGAELGEIFEVEAGSQSEKETLSLSGALTAGSKTVRLSFLNKYWDEVNRRGRHIRLDRLEVRNAAGHVVESRELEELDPATDCNRPVGDHFALHCNGSVDVPIEIPTPGNYAIEVVAWADQVGSELPRLSVMVESDAAGSGGEANPIRNKLVELHDQLLGVQVAPDSPDVEAAYRLFVDVMERGREAEEVRFEWWRCDWSHDKFLFEGILDGAIVQKENERGHTWHDYDKDRVNDFMNNLNFSDPHHTAQAWVVVLAAMMMDYRYLYL